MVADDIVIDRQSCVAGCTCMLCLSWQERCRLNAEIERLREALALAVGELSTHGEYAAWTPEMLMNQFLEEARRG